MGSRRRSNRIGSVVDSVSEACDLSFDPEIPFKTKKKTHRGFPCSEASSFYGLQKTVDAFQAEVMALPAGV